MTLEYEAVGSGEPILFIHGALIADAFRPLVAKSSLPASHHLITYRRRGYGQSGRGNDDLSHPSIRSHVEDALALLTSLDVQAAHVVGHSFGGSVALQLALDAPSAVRSLVLLEPALMIGSSGQAYREALVQGRERYRAEPAADVVHAFLESRWPGYRRPLEQILPGSFERAVADSGAAFEGDIPALLAWAFGEDDAPRLTPPTLSILGGESLALSPRFEEVHRLLLETVPVSEGYVVPGAAHLMPLQEPQLTADAIASFVARH